MAAKNVAKVRKTQVRKAIAAEIRALEKIDTALTKVMAVVDANRASLTPAAADQLADLIAKLNLGSHVVVATIEDRAQALARTFVK